MKTCQKCKSENPDIARYCRHCGCKFNDWLEDKTISKDVQIRIIELENQVSELKKHNSCYIKHISVLKAEASALKEHNSCYKKHISELEDELKVKSHKLEKLDKHDQLKEELINNSKKISKLEADKSRIKSYFWIIIVPIMAFFCTVIYYCYSLEQPNYSGQRYISAVIGQQQYLIIDGKTSDIDVSINATGDPVRYSVQTNIESATFYDVPEWIETEYNDSIGSLQISAAPNYTKTRTSHFTFGCEPYTIGIDVTQKAKAKKALAINGYSSVNTIVAHLGETIYYDIIAEDGECVVKSKPDWCTIERNNNGILAISFKRNPTNEKRTGEITLVSDEYSATIHITQKEGAIKPRSGTIKSVKIDHNVYEDSVKGMRLHICFTTQNMLNFDGRVSIYFYYSDGKSLKDKNGKFLSSDGQVSVSQRFLPSYDDCIYSDFTIFMPYNEFDLSSGKHNLKFNCIIWDLSNGAKEMARSQFYNFQYKKE